MAAFDNIWWCYCRCRRRETGLDGETETLGPRCATLYCLCMSAGAMGTHWVLAPQRSTPYSR